MTIAAQGLGKRFENGNWGLRGIQLELGSGEFCLISGHNGSGKTLLARHLLGLEQADEGQVLLDGHPIERRLTELRRRLAYVFQEPEHQILGMTIGEDVEWTPRRLGWPQAKIEAARIKALSQTGLTGREKDLSAYLSGGEKRRLALAAVLAAEPEMIILDEPFNDLDWPGVKILLSILIDLHRQGIGLLLICHDLEKCLAHATRLVVMERGGIIADGPAEALWEHLPELGLRRPGPQHGSFAGMTWLH